MAALLETLSASGRRRAHTEAAGAVAEEEYLVPTDDVDAEDRAVLRVAEVDSTIDCNSSAHDEDIEKT